MSVETRDPEGLCYLIPTLRNTVTNIRLAGLTGLPTTSCAPYIDVF